MNTDYVLLVEKEEMWAKMLMEVLENNHISYVSQPVYGAGFTIKTGTQEILKIYVPSEDKEKAHKLLCELFPTENI